MACVLALVLAFALASAALAADASSIPIGIAPVVVKMDTATEFSAVEVSNRGDRATGIEIELVQVKWRDGLEIYEATQDFIVSPPAFRVEAGKSRMVRFRYTGARHETEGFYRLFVRQLAEEVAGNQINMVFNLGVPIFIAPTTSHPALALVSATGPDKPAELRNTGNVTLTVLQLEGKSCVDGPKKVMVRLSPGQKSVLQADMATCATSARTDRGLIQLLRP